MNVLGRLLVGVIIGLQVSCLKDKPKVSPPAPVQPTIVEKKLDLTTEKDVRTFRLRLSDEPETLDWNLAHTMNESYLLMNLGEGLVSYDESLRIVPALAERWTVSPDGKTYKFYLRPGVKWSDGVSLKAQDFVYSWKRLLSPVTAASYAYALFDVIGAKKFYSGELKDFDQVGIKAIGDSVLEVRLNKPVAHWIHLPTFWVTFPLRKDVVEKHGASWPKPGRMVSIGPFQLLSHDIGSKMVLERNPLYYGDRGNLERVEYFIVKDDTTALRLYENGKLDFISDISTVNLKKLIGRKDLKRFPYLKTGYLGFSVNQYPASSVHFRRAIAMAIDSTKIQDILYGGQSVAHSFIPPRMMAHSNKIGLPFNVKEAKKELQKESLNLSRVQKISLLTTNVDKSLLLAQFIQNELKKNLNLEVQIKPFDNRTFRSQLDLHAFPLFFGSWGADYPDPDNFMSIFTSEAGNNRFSWKNKEYDKLVLKARYSLKRRDREKLYLEAQKILIEKDAVIVPLFYEPHLALVKPHVKGFELNPMNYLLLRKVNVKVQ
ncbi:MAG: oligopeptide-binding protein oppA [Bdellovibrionaceae bacterium]|nr:oligopeptide-binding protein oppA [Pseudobdellovibrionaceae bacterium]|tara:strand:- start:964 stop:2595 length:1632 start_codon:yes stop_codon:yes gene_type:complete